MKFAKQLEAAVVPEWREKYFDYKAAKKLIKHCSAQSSQSSVDTLKAEDVSSPLSHVSEIRVNAAATNGESIIPTGPSGSYGALNLDGLKAVTGKRSSRLVHHVTKPSSDCIPRNGDQRMHLLANATQAERTFYGFVEDQLDKIDSFYTEREKDAELRLSILKEQFREMKDRRAALLDRNREEVASASQRYRSKPPASFSKRVVGDLKTLLTFADEERLTKHPVKHGRRNDTYTQMTLTYRLAKRRLKLAFQEYYHSLELLHSYSSLNKQALSKILKKFDKTVHARASSIYKTFYDNKHIGKSDAIDALERDSELTFARYYCNGDRKAAASFLRQKQRTEDDRFTMLRIGLSCGVAIPLALEGLIRSFDRTSFTGSAELRSFLLQVWAGFFLVICLAFLFGINCYVWQANRVNYPFIFEWQHAHHLQWTQFFEIPGYILFVFALLFWMCFSGFFQSFTTWYPLVFVCIIAAILVVPFPFLHWSSRRWLLVANGRLLVSGLALVRFQDVFLGDLYTSLSYSSGNIALFWGLYRNHWKNPREFGSSRSMLFGFFTALPGIFRFLHCIRRYADTLHWFPHLINAAKYLITILYYMSLSLWRIRGTRHFKAMFIAFATVNSIFTTFWDLNYDASLLQLHAKPVLLRPQRAYQWTWFYYLFLVVDPLLRCTWIFYIIYEDDIQHAASLSFYIALTEVFRRSLWSLLRVENEHVANVRTYRASRELPLPYALQDVLLSTQPATRITTETKTSQPKLAEAHATDFSRRSDAKSIRSALGSDSDDDEDD